MKHKNIQVYLSKTKIDGRTRDFSVFEEFITKAGRTPEKGDLYLFESKKATKLTALYFDGEQFKTASKTLEKGRYQWQLNEDGTISSSNGNFNEIIDELIEQILNN